MISRLRRPLFRSLFPTLYILTRARHIYRIRHARLLLEYENEARALPVCSAWTQDDIIELASPAADREIERQRRRVLNAKVARHERRNTR